MAEDLTDYLKELGVKVQYLHSEVDTLERVAILRDLRLGVYDVLVGINLLREGIDLPEVTLVAILDADKEGVPPERLVADPDDRTGGPEHRRRGDHVRRQRHRVDAGRDRRDQPPARGPGGLQPREHGIEPTTIIKGIRDLNDRLRAVAESTDRVHLGARGPRRRTDLGRGYRKKVEVLVGADGGRDAVGGQGARVRAGRGAPRRDPADPPAGPRAGRVGHGGPGGGAGPLPGVGTRRSAG